MARLALIMHFFISTTLAGSAVIAVLVMGWGTTWPIVIAGLGGYALGVPVSFVVAKAMIGNQKS